MEGRSVYCIADHVVSPLGNGSLKNYLAAKSGSTGIQLIDDQNFYPKPTQCAKLSQKTAKAEIDGFNNQLTFLENLACDSIRKALSQTSGVSLERTGLFISTTKGNIDLLANSSETNGTNPNVFLSTMAKTISTQMGMKKEPIVVSNACISGVSAILTAKRFIEIGEIDHAIVCGFDLVGKFIVSGFHSFMAISDQPCRPYDKSRDGITLGEGCATIILSKEAHANSGLNAKVKILGGGSSNDANHISGPSRTGEGLVIAMKKAFAQANIDHSEIAYISAHGTATPYNDEMEALAFAQMNLSETPLNSLKGYFGHTLGAAGILESIIGLHQLKDGEALPTRDLDTMGVSKPVNASNQSIALKNSKYFLKTISGFGGFNAAVIFELEN